jgi:hypothetical protein
VRGTAHRTQRPHHRGCRRCGCAQPCLGARQRAARLSRRRRSDGQEDARLTSTRVRGAPAPLDRWFVRAVYRVRLRFPGRRRGLWERLRLGHYQFGRLCGLSARRQPAYRAPSHGQQLGTRSCGHGAFAMIVPAMTTPVAERIPRRTAAGIAFQLGGRSLWAATNRPICSAYLLSLIGIFSSPHEMQIAYRRPASTDITSRCHSQQLP